MIIRLLILLCFFFAQLASAKTPVEVNSTTPDIVGQRLVFALKEGIRLSSSLDISFDQSKPRMQVNIVTLDSDTTNPGYSTVYSMVILWNTLYYPFQLYLSQVVGSCGSSRVRECADSMVANVSEVVDSLQKIFQTVPKR